MSCCISGGYRGGTQTGGMSDGSRSITTTYGPSLCDRSRVTRVVSGGDGVCLGSGGIEKGMGQGDCLAILSDCASGDGLSDRGVCPGASEAAGCEGECFGNSAAIRSGAGDDSTGDGGNVDSGDGPGSGDYGTIVSDRLDGTGDRGGGDGGGRSVCPGFGKGMYNCGSFVISHGCHLTTSRQSSHSDALPRQGSRSGP